MQWLISRCRPAFLATAVLGCLLFVYCASYVALSVRGRYEPVVFGSGGVKAYGWVPRGLMTNGQWNRPVLVLYYPLFLLDYWYWHTPRRS